MKDSTIYRTDNLEVFQDDRSGHVILDFYGDLISFRLCEFVSFKRKMLQLDLVKLFDSHTPDQELIYLPHCDRFLLLSIHQILELREVFMGAYAMLELNSLIHSRIIRKGVSV